MIYIVYLTAAHGANAAGADRCAACEGPLKNEADTNATPFPWEPAATLGAATTMHIVNLEPGLAYSFRLAALSEAAGQLPFSTPTQPVSALGSPPVDGARRSACDPPPSRAAPSPCPARRCCSAE